MTVQNEYLRQRNHLLLVGDVVRAVTGQHNMVVCYQSKPVEFDEPASYVTDVTFQEREAGFQIGVGIESPASTDPEEYFGFKVYFLVAGLGYTFSGNSDHYERHLEEVAQLITVYDYTS